MSHIAENIVKLRKVKHLSQTKFAEIFSLTRASVGAYEEGRAEPKLDKLIEIAHYFGLTLDQLVTKQLTENDILHSSYEFTNSNTHIPFISLVDKKKFITTLPESLSGEGYPKVFVPGIVADMAFEIEDFSGQKNSLVFGRKVYKLRPLHWYLTIKGGDYNIFYSQTDLKYDYLWEICCILVKDIKYLEAVSIQMKRIEEKIDFLIGLQKK